MKHVRDIMTNKVVVAKADHKLTQAFEFFANFSIHHLPVVEGDRVVGIVSARDVIKKLYEEVVKNHLEINFAKLDEELTVKDVMTIAPISVRPGDSVKDVAKIFKDNSFHALPVEENGEIKGIVTTKDLAKSIA